MEINVKWKTIIEAVDVDTGEVISRRLIDNGEYTIINTCTIKYEKKDDTITRTYRWECQRNKQLRLF